MSDLDRGGTLQGRRKHNFDQIKVFLDRDYPNTAPGSPDREQVFDDNKKGSRVVMKQAALKRVDDRYFGKGIVSRSYDRLVKEFERSDWVSPVHALAVRYVLLNLNSPGGYKELQRLEDIKVPSLASIRTVMQKEDEKRPETERIGKRRIEERASAEYRRLKDNARAASDVAAMCRHVIERVLDRLDDEGFWLNWGHDETVQERRKEAADRRRASVLSDEAAAYRAIRAYHELQLQTFDTVEEAERATCEHFGCSRSKVRRTQTGGDIANAV